VRGEDGRPRPSWRAKLARPAGGDWAYTRMGERQVPLTVLAEKASRLPARGIWQLCLDDPEMKYGG
jgi:hypothetical protein